MYWKCNECEIFYKKEMGGGIDGKYNSSKSG